MNVGQLDMRDMTSCSCVMLMLRDIFAAAWLHDILDDTLEDLSEGDSALPQGVKHDDKRGDKGPDYGDYNPSGEPTDSVDRRGKEEREWDQDDHD